MDEMNDMTTDVKKADDITQAGKAADGVMSADELSREPVPGETTADESIPAGNISDGTAADGAAQTNIISSADAEQTGEATATAVATAAVTASETATAAAVTETAVTPAATATAAATAAVTATETAEAAATVTAAMTSDAPSLPPPSGYAADGDMGLSGAALLMTVKDNLEADLYIKMLRKNDTEVIGERQPSPLTGFNLYVPGAQLDHARKLVADFDNEPIAYNKPPPPPLNQRSRANQILYAIIIFLVIVMPIGIAAVVMVYRLIRILFQP